MTTTSPCSTAGRAPQLPEPPPEPGQPLAPPDAAGPAGAGAGAGVAGGGEGGVGGDGGPAGDDVATGASPGASRAGSARRWDTLDAPRVDGPRLPTRDAAPCSPG